MIDKQVHADFNNIADRQKFKLDDIIAFLEKDIESKKRFPLVMVETRVDGIAKFGKNYGHDESFSKRLESAFDKLEQSVTALKLAKEIQAPGFRIDLDTRQAIAPQVISFAEGIKPALEKSDTSQPQSAPAQTSGMAF